MVKLLWKKSGSSSKSYMELPSSWSSSYIPRHIPKRNENTYPYKNFYVNDYSSFIPNSQQVEKNQMSINWKMDKQNVVYIYWPTYSRYIQLGIYNVCVLVASHVWIFVTPRTVAHQAPLSMARIQEYIAISFSRGSSWPRIESRSPALQADSLPSELYVLRHRDYTSYDYMQMKYPEWANQQRQRVYEWLSKAERTGGK